MGLAACRYSICNATMLDFYFIIMHCFDSLGSCHKRVSSGTILYPFYVMWQLPWINVLWTSVSISIEQLNAMVLRGWRFNDELIFLSNWIDAFGYCRPRVVARDVLPCAADGWHCNEAIVGLSSYYVSRFARLFAAVVQELSILWLLRSFILF